MKNLEDSIKHERTEEKYTSEELESFVKGIIGASSFMRQSYEQMSMDCFNKGTEIGSPYYIISLHGCLPLFDILTMVDPSVDTDRAIYFPGSSRVQDSRDVLRRCFENFLLEKEEETGELTPLFSLDEVVGGHSVERLIKSYESALRRVARHKLEGRERRRGDIEEDVYDLKQLFPLKIFGLRDLRKNRKMSLEYQKRVDERQIIEVPVKRIITMDDPDYEIVTFDHPKSNGWRANEGFYPRVLETRRTSLYESLLKDIARYVGADPERISLERSRIISDCEKYSRKPRL